MTEQTIIQKIKREGLIPLFYHADKNVCIKIARALYAAGIRIIEFTNRGENALKNFKALMEEKDKSMQDMLLAVGTIKTAEQATQFINAGADFLISPVFDSSVCDVTYMNKILWVPGCMTATEIHTAEQAGCTLIKLFPGNILGPSFVEAIRPLFQNLDFVVTGGVDTTEENIKAWFKAGVAGVGMGSKLITNEILQNGKYDELETKTKELIALIGKIK